jgi:hypothetical protein
LIGSGNGSFFIIFFQYSSATPPVLPSLRFTNRRKLKKQKEALSVFKTSSFDL